MLSIRTILHPTNFEATSANALSLACALASDYDANLVIVHVIAIPLILPGGAIFPDLNNNDTAAIRKKLDHLKIPYDGIDVERQVEEGNPATEILCLAELCHADLIVMGSQRRSGWARWFTGSVADAVLRQATCPVLIVTYPCTRSMPAQQQDHVQGSTLAK
jgi:nucleotide-binding universal stress UspA family protein